MSDVLDLLLGAISFVVGGGISRFLESQEGWVDWHPFVPAWVPLFGGKPAPFLKSLAVFLIVGAVLLLLIIPYQFLPVLVPQLSQEWQGVFVMFFGALGAYVRHQTSTLARLREES